MPPTRQDPTRRGWTHASELARVIIDTSPFAAMAFDVDGRIIFWSSGAERMFGWKAEELLGLPFPTESIPEEEMSTSRERIQRTIEGAVISGERVRRLARDGRELILEIHGTALREESARYDYSAVARGV